MESRFDGTVMELFGVNLTVYLLCLVTLGIAYPWALVMKRNYVVSHTLIDGQRVRFDGTGGQLFGIWVKISLLTFITLGIYYFWAELEVQQWVAQHTHLEGAYTAAPVLRQQPPVPAPLPQAYAPAPVAAQEAAAIAAPVFAPLPAAVAPHYEAAAQAAAPGVCAACGSRLPENARFCQKCGCRTV